MIPGTRIKRCQSLSLPHVLQVDFTCEPCRLISLLANEQGAWCAARLRRDRSVIAAATHMTKVAAAK